MQRHSTSPPCGNLVDGLPHDCHNTEPRWIGVTLDPRRFMIMVDIFMFLVIFYIMSDWFVTFRCFILYWSLIFGEYQPWCSTKPWLTTSVTLHQNVEKMMKCSNFHENFEWENEANNDFVDFRSTKWMRKCSWEFRAFFSL